jgi:ATP-dependent helicase HrpB
MAATDPLRRAPLLAVAQLDLIGTEARIRMAAPLDLALLEARFPDRMRWVEGAVFDARTGTVTARRRKMFGPLILEEAAPQNPDPEALAQALAQAAAERDWRDLDWTEAAKQAQARIGWMRRSDPSWPDATLTTIALATQLYGRSKLSELRAIDTHALIMGLLTHEQRRALEAALPARLPLPKGRSAAVDYTAEVPRLEARAQHLYGVTTTPRLAGGAVPLHIALLSPAGRPIAITADLAGFWAGGWRDARKDMRGRYPKHDWPEQPWLAKPPPPRDSTRRS